MIGLHVCCLDWQWQWDCIKLFSKGSSSGMHASLGLARASLLLTALLARHMARLVIRAPPDV
jgi:hypothetical protein